MPKGGWNVDLSEKLSAGETLGYLTVVAGGLCLAVYSEYGGRPWLIAAVLLGVVGLRLAATAKRRARTASPLTIDDRSPRDEKRIQSAAGVTSATIADESGNVFTFFNDGADLYFLEGAAVNAPEENRIRIKITYPRGLWRCLLHGLLRRGDFRFWDDHGKEWEIRTDPDVFAEFVQWASSPAGSRPG